MTEETFEQIENFKEFKPILQQQILEKELKFMEEVKSRHSQFKELDSNLSFLITCVETLKKNVIQLSEELNKTFTGFQELHDNAKKINMFVEQDKHVHEMLSNILTKCIPHPEMIQRLLTQQMDGKYTSDLIEYHKLIERFDEIKMEYSNSPIIQLMTEYHKHTTTFICQRIYDLLSQKLNKLSESNPIIIQHHLANNYSIHFRFLMRYSEENCIILRDNHMECMKILLFQYFQCYTDEIIKLRSTKPINKTFEFIEYIVRDRVFKPITDKEKDTLEAMRLIKTRIDIQKDVSDKDDEIIIPAFTNDTKDAKYELETIIDSLYRVLSDTIASHVDCYIRLYRRLTISQEQLNEELNIMVAKVFDPIFNYFMQTVIDPFIIHQHLDSFTYFIYLREFVNCQNFIDKNYEILSGIHPLREHLNTVTNGIIEKANFLLNNSIYYVQNCAQNPKKEKSPIHSLTRKYAQYTALLHYAHVIHYYQDLEELQWKLRTSIEAYISQTSSCRSDKDEITTSFNEFINVVYILCFLKRQDDEYLSLKKDVKDLSIKEKQRINNDIFNFQHNMEMKRDNLSNLFIEKHFFFLIETMQTIKQYEILRDQQEQLTSDQNTVLVDHLRGFVATFKEKWSSKLKEMMIMIEEISLIKDKTIEYSEDIEKELKTELQRHILKQFLGMCEYVDNTLKGSLIPNDVRLELIRGYVTFAAIYAEVNRFMDAIAKGISFKSL